MSQKTFFMILFILGQIPGFLILGFAPIPPDKITDVFFGVLLFFPVWLCLSLFISFKYKKRICND